MKNHKLNIVFVLVSLLALTTSFKPTEKERRQYVEVYTSYGRFIIGLYNETPLHRDNFIKIAQEKGFDSLLFHRVIPQLMIQGGDPRSKHAKPGAVVGNADVGTPIPMELSKDLYHKRGAVAMARDRRNQYESSPHQFYIVQGQRFTPEELLEIENNNNITGKREMLNKVMQSDSVIKKVDDFKLRGDKEGLHNYLVGMEDHLEKMYEPKIFSFSAEQGREYIRNGGAPHLDQLYTVFGEVIYGMNVVDSIAGVARDEHDRPLTDIRMTVKVVAQKAPTKN